jgi:hypothetical protein
VQLLQALAILDITLTPRHMLGLARIDQQNFIKHIDWRFRSLEIMSQRIEFVQDAVNAGGLARVRLVRKER